MWGIFSARAPDGKPLWRRNIWGNGLADTPFPETARRDLLRWRADDGAASEAQDRYLDTLTYKDYLERVRGYDPAVTRLVEPIVGLLSGVSADAASARVGRQLVEPPRPAHGAVVSGWQLALSTRSAAGAAACGVAGEGFQQSDVWRS